MKPNKDRPKGISADFDGDQFNTGPCGPKPVLSNWRFVVLILLAQTLLAAIFATVCVGFVYTSNFTLIVVQIATMALLMNKTGLAKHRPTDYNVRCVKVFVTIPMGFWAFTGYLLDIPGTEDPRVLLCTVACGFHSILALWTVTRPLPSERMKRKVK